MTKKFNEEFVGTEFKAEEFEENAPDVAEPAMPKEVPSIKHPFKVDGRIGNELVMVDENGNGFRIPVTEKNKNAKKGDTLNL